MDLQLNGKRALVSGGSRGIGKARCARAGAWRVPTSRCWRAMRSASPPRRASLGPRRGARWSVCAATPPATNRCALRWPTRCASPAVRSTSWSTPLPSQAATARHRSSARSGGAFFHAEMDTKVMGYVRCAREVAAGHAGARLGPHRQHQRPGRAAERQRGGQHAQRRGRRADQEPRRRARAVRHQRHRGASGPDAAPSAPPRWWQRAERTGRGDPRPSKRRWRRATRSSTWSTPAEVADVVAFLCSPRFASRSTATRSRPAAARRAAFTTDPAPMRPGRPPHLMWRRRQRAWRSRIRGCLAAGLTRAMCTVGWWR